MKKLIRNQCFETNSSSCHSISISDTSGILDTLIPNEDGVLMVEAGEFGWNEEEYTDAQSKLSYLLIYLRDWVQDETQREELRAKLNQVVLSHTQATNIVLDDNYDPKKPYSASGHIDHQSVESRDLDYIFHSEELIKNFIFNPSSVLKTDNDNH